MIEQTKLRDVIWVCANSRLGCHVVIPCFGADGAAGEMLIVTREWGWLIAPAGPRLVRQGMGIRFDGPLEELFKLSPRVMDRLAGLYHFDPWWLALAADSGLPGDVASAIAATNLAGAAFGRLAVGEVVFDDALRQVERVDVGSALWRRELAGKPLTDWLAGRPAITPRQAGTLAGGLVERPAELYAPAGEGPLKAVSPRHRVGGGRVTIGQPETGQPETGQSFRPQPQPLRTALTGRDPAGRTTAAHELAGRDPVKPAMGTANEITGPQQSAFVTTRIDSAAVVAKPQAAPGPNAVAPEPHERIPLRPAGSRVPPAHPAPPAKPPARPAASSPRATLPPPRVQPLPPSGHSPQAPQKPGRQDLDQVQQAIENIRQRIQRGRDR